MRSKNWQKEHDDSELDRDVADGLLAVGVQDWFAENNVLSLNRDDC